MKYRYIILFLFIISCSKKNEILVDLNSFKKQGREIFFQDKIEYSKEIFKISKINLEDKLNEILINNQKYNFNSNFHELKKINKFYQDKNNIYKKEIFVLKNKMYYVNDYGELNIILISTNKKKIIQLYSKKEIKGYPARFSITGNDKYIYIADNLGGIHAYDIDNDKILWKFNLGVPFISNIVLYKNNIYVSNANGKIFSFLASNGNQNWSYESGSGFIKTRNAFKLSIQNDYLVFTNNLKEITCIDLKNKKLLWSKYYLQFKITSSQNFFEFSNLIINDKELIFFSSDNNLYNINLLNGDINWQKKLLFSNLIQYNKNHLLFISNDGFIKILNLKNQNVVYSINLNKYIKNKDKKNSIEINNILSMGKSIFLTSVEGDFFKISTTNLKDIYYKKITQSINSNLQISNNHLYFIGNFKYLYSLN